MAKKKISKTHYEVSYSNYPKTKFASSKSEAERIARGSPTSWGRTSIKKSSLSALLKRRKK